MKKVIYSLCLLSIFFSSCKKEATNSENTDRGEISGNPEFKVTYSKSDLQFGIYLLSPVYADSIHFNYDVEGYKLVYYTIDAWGNPAKASGLIIIPKASSTALPMVSFQHGTILKKDACPSNLQGGYEAGLIFGTEGYVALCPDYLGLGESEKLHPYLNAKTEASAVIDFIRAAKKFCNSKNIALNSKLFLLGYSQGGHATMAAAKTINDEFYNELPVTACAPMAGSYDMSGTQLHYMLQNKSYPSPAYLPYFLFGNNNIYTIFNSPGDVFIQPYDSEFPKYFNDNPQEDFDAVNNIWPEGNKVLDVLKPSVVDQIKNNPDFSVNEALKDNDVYKWIPEFPVTLCHCDSDTQVPFQNSEVAYSYFVSHGAQNIQLIDPFPGGNHTTCSIPSMFFALKWFNTLKD